MIDGIPVTTSGDATMTHGNNECPVIDVPTAALVKLCDPLRNPPWMKRGIAPDEVQRAVESGHLLDAVHGEFDKWTRRQHIERIAWFVTNGWEDPIEIDVGIPVLGFSPKWPILDGNHRLCAALLRGDETIRATIGGQIDFAEEIFGISWPDGNSDIDDSQIGIRN